MNMHLNKYSSKPFEFMSCLCKEKKESSNSQGFQRQEEERAARLRGKKATLDAENKCVCWCQRGSH